MSRLSLPRLSHLLLALLLVAPAARGQERPLNVLIIYADDLGYGDLSCQNPDSRIPTPHLDRLASQSLRFTDGHSSSGICTPSRYALLTGRHHWRDFHGIVNAFGKSVFPAERLTLPEMLRERGYRTACIGKWHLGWDWEAIRKKDARPRGEGRRKAYGPEAFHWDRPIPDGPLAHGFDHYFGDTVINFPPYCWIEDDRVTRAPDVMMDSSKWKEIKEGRWECRPGPMVSDWDPYQVLPTLTERGVEYLRRQKDSKQPFFLFFSLPSPHAPIIPLDRFDGKSEAGAYGDFVFQTDETCGQLLAALEKTGLDRNTIVIFTADNGPEKYAYARDVKHGHWSAWPFRGLKRDIYEGGHHVPFLVRWPGITRPGTTSGALVSQIDLMATLARHVDYELPDDAAEDSHDLLPLLRGEEKSVRRTHVHNTHSSKYAIRHDRWLLVDAKDGYHSGRDRNWEARRAYPPDDDGPVELYDLESDPGQKKNLADEHPARVKELRALLQEIRERGHSAPRLQED